MISFLTRRTTKPALARHHTEPFEPVLAPGALRWKYFWGACLVVGAALFKAGAPLFTVVLGVSLAAWMNILRHRSRTPPKSKAAKAR